MYKDEEFNSPIIDLAGYREERATDNVVSFQDSITRYRKFERKALRSEKEGSVILFSLRRMAAMSSKYV